MYILTEQQLEDIVDMALSRGNTWELQSLKWNEFLADTMQDVKTVLASQSSTWECAFGEIHQSDHQCTCE